MYSSPSITERPTGEGKLYLCAAKDACSRRLAGYSIDDRMRSSLAVAAMGSFFTPLQKNVLNRQRWATREELRLELITWIEATYHRRRRQRGLEKSTPGEYETIINPQVALAA